MGTSSIQEIDELIELVIQLNLYAPVSNFGEPGFVPFDANPLFEKLGEPAIKALVAELKHEDKRHRNRSMAVLGRISNAGEDVVAALIESLKDDDQFNRQNAILCLAVAGRDSEAAQLALLETLSDTNSIMRLEAAKAVASLSPLPVALLRRAMVSGGGPTRQYVVETLAKRGNDGKEALPELVSALNDKYENISRGALIAISAMDAETPGVLNALVTGMTSSRRRVGRLAAESMKEIGKPAFPKILKLLKHDDFDVRSNAIWVLSSMKEQTPIEIVTAISSSLEDGDMKIRAEVANEFRRMGPAAIPALPALKRALESTSKANVQIHDKRAKTDAIKWINAAITDVERHRDAAQKNERK